MPEHEQDAYFTIAEARTMLLAMAAADYLRLQQYARMFGQRTDGEGDDLLQEAFERTLDGRRRWRRDLSVKVFIFGVMESMSSKKVERIAKQREAREDWKRCDQGRENKENIHDQPAELHPALDRTDAKLKLEAIEKRLSDDLDALHVLREAMIGKTAEEIAAELRLTLGQVKAARKRIKKAMEGLWP